MNCPKPQCDGILIWGNDFDIEEGDQTDKDGEPYIVQSFWNCIQCDTQVCIPS